MQLHTLTTTIINRELMMLANAKHGLLMDSLDPVESQVVYRWFADGRMVSFRLPMEALLLSLNALDSQYLDAVIAEWKKAEPFDDPEAEFARLRNAPLGAHISRHEEWIRG